MNEWVFLALLAGVFALMVATSFLPHRERPFTGDWCRVCEQDLRVGQVWEVRTSHEAAEDGVGGTYMAITYCRRHKPRNAVKA